MFSPDICEHGLFDSGERELCGAGVRDSLFVPNEFPDGILNHVIDRDVLLAGIVNYLVFETALHTYVQNYVLIYKARLFCAPAHQLSRSTRALM